jgi:predicted alpha/beta-fold hydrolase
MVHWVKLRPCSLIYLESQKIMRSIKIPFLLSLAAVVLLLCSACSGTEQKVRTEPIRLQTTDGIWLDGVLRQPHPDQIEAGVLMVHGYGGNFYSGIMSFLPEALAEHGFTTLALNMRDHDLGPKKNLFEENLQDIATGVDEMARRRYKTKRTSWKSLSMERESIRPGSGKQSSPPGPGAASRRQGGLLDAH